MDRETNDLIARLYLSEKNLSQVDAGDLAAWARLEMGRGHDSESLKQLAADEITDSAAAEALFRRCVDDLGWEMPQKKAALRSHAESIMRRIVDGEMEPYDGCSHLYIISIYLKHPDYLYNWNGLFWAREDLAEDELNELITEEARRGLSGETTPINDDLPRQEQAEEEKPGFWDRVKELIRQR